LTSVLQPLDLLINVCFKRHAKIGYIKWLHGGTGPVSAKWAIF
jgi:hypothetical protein